MFNFKEKPLFDCVKSKNNNSYKIYVDGKIHKIFNKSKSEEANYLDAQKYMMTNEFLAVVYSKI